MQMLCHSENHVNPVHMDDGKNGAFKLERDTRKEKRGYLDKCPEVFLELESNQIGRRPTINRKRAQRSETALTHE